MNDEIRRQNDRVVRNLLSRVNSLLTAGNVEQALRLVNRIDLQYPNRRNVIELRQRCLQMTGKRQFEEWSEDDDRVSVDFDAGRIDWLDMTTEEERNRPPERIAAPTLTAFDPTAYRDPEPAVRAPEPSQGLLSFSVWTVLIVAYGLVLARELVPQLRGGEIRNFSGMQFVWIPHNHEMHETDPVNSSANSVPGFWIGRYEVTQKQWFDLMKSNPSGHHGEQLPVDSVTRDEVLEFLDALNRLGNGRFRLPTEAEWQLACRGETRGAAGFGGADGTPDQVAWYSTNSENATHEVGGKKATGWGLFDQFGNVAELCTAKQMFAWGETELPLYVNSEDPWVVKGGSAADDMGGVSPLTARTLASYNRVFVGLRLVREAGKDPGGTVRVVHFPKHYSLGTLRTKRRPIGEAMGDIRVRRDEGLILEFSKDARQHWDNLAKLRSDDLAELTAANLDLRDRDIKVLSKLSGIKVLNLAKNPLTDEALQFIAPLTQLKQLRLGDTEISGAQLDRLAELDYLEQLSLSRCQYLSGASVNALLTLSNLKLLDLYGCGFSKDQLFELQIGLPECTIRPELESPSLETSLKIATVGKKYAMLLEQFPDPDAAKDFGFFFDAGYIDSFEYMNVNRPAGYWVYVKPYWYIWAGLGREFAPRILALERQAGPWNAKNAIGEPNHEDHASAQATWSPGHLENISSWLMVEFDHPVEPLVLRLHVTNPVVNLSHVTAFTLTGKETTVWRSVPELNPDADAWTVELPLSISTTDQDGTGKVSRFQIYINGDSEAVSQKQGGDRPATCIDAVELINNNGESLWARAAVANSDFAQGDGSLRAGPGDEKDRPRFVDPATIEFQGVFGLFADLARANTEKQDETR